MTLGEHARAVSRGLKAVGLSLALLIAPQAALAAAPVPPEAKAPAASSSGPAVATPAPGVDPAKADAAYRAPDVAGNPASATPGDEKTVEAAVAPRMKPTTGIGMPIPDAVGLQQQFSPLGEYAHWIHDGVLLPIIGVISLLVLVLLVWVIIRFNRGANPVPSRTSHNTLIEVVWTLVPVLVLVGIAIPSIDLLAKQYKPAPARALTIKATGNQWFWSYTYPDNGGFELTSYMLNEPGMPVVNNGVREVGSDPSDGPRQLEVDNRLVVPVGEPIRLQVTGADVIHSFGVPSLWFKLDAVPGRINEKVLLIEKPGVYYGQCYELCGAKHAFMPIAIEALPRPQFNAWVLRQSGGVIDGQPAPAAAGAPATAGAPAAPGAAPLKVAAPGDTAAAATASGAPASPASSAAAAE